MEPVPETVRGLAPEGFPAPVPEAVIPAMPDRDATET